MKREQNRVNCQEEIIKRKIVLGIKAVSRSFWGFLDHGKIILLSIWIHLWGTRKEMQKQIGIKGWYNSPQRGAQYCISMIELMHPQGLPLSSQQWPLQLFWPLFDQPCLETPTKQYISDVKKSNSLPFYYKLIERIIKIRQRIFWIRLYFHHRGKHMNLVIIRWVCFKTTSQNFKNHYKVFLI